LVLVFMVRKREKREEVSDLYLPSYTRTQAQPHTHIKEKLSNLHRNPSIIPNSNTTANYSLILLLKLEQVNHICLVCYK